MLSCLALRRMMGRRGGGRRAGQGTCTRASAAGSYLPIMSHRMFSSADSGFPSHCWGEKGLGLGAHGRRPGGARDLGGSPRNDASE